MLLTNSVERCLVLVFQKAVHGMKPAVIFLNGLRKIHTKGVSEHIFHPENINNY